MDLAGQRHVHPVGEVDAQRRHRRRVAGEGDELLPGRPGVVHHGPARAGVPGDRAHGQGEGGEVRGVVEHLDLRAAAAAVLEAHGARTEPEVLQIRGGHRLSSKAREIDTARECFQIRELRHFYAIFAEYFMFSGKRPPNWGGIH